MKQIKNISSKPFWHSKTMWVNFLTLTLGILEIIRSNTISPNVLVLIAVINLVLRFMTSTPVSLK